MLTSSGDDGGHRVKLIESKEALQAWDDYRELLKVQLKLLADTDVIFVSKEKIPFEIAGKPWNAHAVLAGVKGQMSVQKLRKAGVIFREGTCSKAGKELELAGLEAKLVKGAARTLAKLRLGYTIAGVDEEGADESADGDASAPASAGAASAGAASGPVDLAERAKRIAKAVQVWSKTEAAATKELRKLQKALLALDDPRTRAVIQGLETILARIDRVDDEGRAVEAAAAQGDAAAFDKARADFLGKLDAIRAHVEQDELIRMADSNPLLEVKLRDTYAKSLARLIKAV
jgi:hypothetical protein